jgi:hypothetical protein
MPREPIIISQVPPLTLLDAPWFDFTDRRFAGTTLFLQYVGLKHCRKVKRRTLPQRKRIVLWHRLIRRLSLPPQICGGETVTTALCRVERCLPPPTAPMPPVMVAPVAAPVDLLDRSRGRYDISELAEGDARSGRGLRAASGDDAGECACSDGQGNHSGHYGSFPVGAR